MRRADGAGGLTLRDWLGKCVLTPLALMDWRCAIGRENAL